jgi:hypothetical protein
MANMLWTMSDGGFRFVASNQDAPSLTPGTSITPGNNTYPAYAEILSDASVTEDCFGIFIRVTGINVSTTAKDAIFKIGIDTAGGTTFVDFISHLSASCAQSTATTVAAGCVDYYFPVFIPAGTAIAATCSVNNATVGTARVFIKLFGGVARRELLAYGHGVDSFGEVTGSSRGTTITPGTSGAAGTYVQMGSNTAKQYMWWQVGFGINNGTITNLAYWVDLAAGDATNKDIIISDEQYQAGTQEGLSGPRTYMNYWREVPSGVGIYARASSSGTPVSGCSAIAHGVW